MIPFSVAFDAANGIVSVHISKAAGVPERRAARDRMIALCLETGCERALVDLREVDVTGSRTMDVVNFGLEFARVTKKLRVANVLPQDSKAVADISLAATLTEAGGTIKSRTFASVEQARNWLKSAA
jgi:hypothetical protein